MFDKVDGFVSGYDGTKQLVLFGLEIYMLFAIGLDILQVKKVVLHIFIIIVEESKLIQMMICLQKEC